MWMMSLGYRFSNIGEERLELEVMLFTGPVRTDMGPPRCGKPAAGRYSA